MSKRAFLYAGQGAQVKGMGKDLYEAFPAFRKAYDEAELDFNVKELSFFDPEEKLNETQDLQVHEYYSHSANKKNVPTIPLHY